MNGQNTSGQNSGLPYPLNVNTKQIKLNAPSNLQKSQSENASSAAFYSAKSGENRDNMPRIDTLTSAGVKTNMEASANTGVSANMDMKTNTNAQANMGASVNMDVKTNTNAQANNILAKSNLSTHSEKLNNTPTNILAKSNLPTHSEKLNNTPTNILAKSNLPTHSEKLNNTPTKINDTLIQSHNIDDKYNFIKNLKPESGNLRLKNDILIYLGFIQVPSNNNGQPGNKSVSANNNGQPSNNTVPANNNGQPGNKSVSANNNGQPGNKSVPANNNGQPGNKSVSANNNGQPGNKSVSANNSTPPNKKLTDKERDDMIFYDVNDEMRAELYKQNSNNASLNSNENAEWGYNNGYTGKSNSSEKSVETNVNHKNTPYVTTAATIAAANSNPNGIELTSISQSDKHQMPPVNSHNTKSNLTRRNYLTSAASAVSSAIYNVPRAISNNIKNIYSKSSYNINPLSSELERTGVFVERRSYDDSNEVKLNTISNNSSQLLSNKLESKQPTNTNTTVTNIQQSNPNVVKTQSTNIAKYDPNANVFDPNAMSDQAMITAQNNNSAPILLTNPTKTDKTTIQLLNDIKAEHDKVKNKSVILKDKTNTLVNSFKSLQKGGSGKKTRKYKKNNEPLRKYLMTRKMIRY